MSETDKEHEVRLRQLERDQATAAARLDGVEAQQRAAWTELSRISKEGRDEFTKLRQEHHESTERLLTAINANKIAWSMMSGGQKVAAWIIGTLIGFAGLLVAGASAVKRLFFTD